MPTGGRPPRARQSFTRIAARSTVADRQPDVAPGNLPRGFRPKALFFEDRPPNNRRGQKGGYEEEIFNKLGYSFVSQSPRQSRTLQCLGLGDGQNCMQVMHCYPSLPGKRSVSFICCKLDDLSSVRTNYQRRTINNKRWPRGFCPGASGLKLYFLTIDQRGLAQS